MSALLAAHAASRRSFSAGAGAAVAGDGAAPPRLWTPLLLMMRIVPGHSWATAVHYYVLHSADTLIYTTAWPFSRLPRASDYRVCAGACVWTAI